MTITYNPAGRSLASAASVYLHYAPGEWNSQRIIPRPAMTLTNIGTSETPTNVWRFTTNLPANASILRMVFTANPETSQNLAWDNNGGADWNIGVTNQPPPTNPPTVPTGLQITATTADTVSLAWNAAPTASAYIVYRNGAQVGAPQDTNFVDVGLLPLTTYRYALRATNVAGQSGLSAEASGTTSFAPLNPNQIMVVDPPAPADALGASYLFRVRAGSAFTNGVSWTNPLTGGSGLIAFPGGDVANGWEWSTNIALGNGTNAVSFTGLYGTSAPQTLTDSAANYSAWTNGASGGTGFGAWSLTTSSTNAGHFLANNSTNMDVGSATGLGLWANNGGASTAMRNFNTPMAAGDSFALRFDNNFIIGGSEVGFALADNSGNIKLRFYFVGGQSNYRITDANTARDSGLAYTSGGLNLTVTLNSSTNYTLSTGATNVTGILAAAGGAISRLIVENKNAGPDTPHNLYIGSMTHTRQIADSGTFSISAPMVTFASGQTDGLPDSWWSQYGIIGVDRVAANDPDRDGFDNAKEHALGTDPTNSASAFRITSIVPAANSTTVTWSSVAGKRYSLQGATNLGNLSWSNIGSPVSATNHSASTNHATSGGQHFYRVILAP